MHHIVELMALKLHFQLFLARKVQLDEMDTLVLQVLA